MALGYPLPTPGGKGNKPRLGGRLVGLGTPPTPKKTKARDPDSSGQTLILLSVYFQFNKACALHLTVCCAFELFLRA